jgi:hypothetical protein
MPRSCTLKCHKCHWRYYIGCTGKHCSVCLSPITDRESYHADANGARHWRCDHDETADKAATHATKTVACDSAYFHHPQG